MGLEPDRPPRFFPNRGKSRHDSVEISDVPAVMLDGPVDPLKAQRKSAVRYDHFPEF